MGHPTRNALPWLGLSLLVVVLDALTKQWAMTTLTFQQPVPVLEGVLNWTLLHNTGAAFSFLAEHGGWQRWLFSGLALAISLLLGFWLSRIPRHDWRLALPYALVIGGAVGNLIDRLRFGYVIDFIEAYWRNYHWPAFNLADSAIVGGAIGIALFGLIPRRSRPDGG